MDPSLTSPPRHLLPDAPERPRRPTRSSLVLDRLDDVTVSVAARTGVSPRAVVGLLLVAVVAIGVLAARFVVTDARARPHPIVPASAKVRLASSSVLSSLPPSPPSSRFPAAASAGAGVATSGATGPVAASGVVLVHVVGEVRRPGVVRLAVGARVQDAVVAAGGATHRADLAAVNLARLLVDGEQIVVPRPGQATAPASGPWASGQPSGTTTGAAPAVVDLNAATAAQLDSLPGIGPVLAGRIVDFREQHGRFTSVDELGEVSGIGDALLGRLRPLVRV